MVIAHKKECAYQVGLCTSLGGNKAILIYMPEDISIPSYERARSGSWYLDGYYISFCSYDLW
jgi:hypothetical protein